jgi:hypothetical protein
MLKHALAAIALAGFGTLCGGCGGEGSMVPASEGADVATAQQAEEHWFTIYNTGGLGAHSRKCARRDCASVEILSDGAEINVVCQKHGENVPDGKYSSDVWDRLDDGNFVSDLYVDTPVVGDLSPGIPVCRD